MTTRPSSQGVGDGDIKVAASAGWDAAITVLSTMRERWRLMLAVASVVLLLGAILTLRGREFSARASITPEAAASSAPQLGNLALQFGVNLGAGAAGVGDPVRFYEELLRSRDILRAAVTTSYRFATPDNDTLVGDFASLYAVQGANDAERIDRAISMLRRQVTPSTVRDAGIVRLQTVARWPALAEQLNRRLLDLVATFNLERRQSQASARRAFVEGRLTEVGHALTAAEDSLEAFLARHRVRSSPDLDLALERLRRTVTLREQVHTQLAIAFEEARIDEVRATPVVTVVEVPEGSARPVGSVARDLLTWLVIALLIGGVAAVVAGSWAEYRRDHRAQLAGLPTGPSRDR
ncbi:MAG: hypothetical protein WD043_04240 [Gemmatimonadales bacterium]